MMTRRQRLWPPFRFAGPGVASEMQVICLLAFGAYPHASTGSNVMLSGLSHLMSIT
jgi:hypothetical protein